MALYILKKNVGSHTDLKGKKYFSGDMIKSDVDLVVKFPGKFDLTNESMQPVVNTPSRPEIPGPMSDVGESESPTDPTLDIDNDGDKIEEEVKYGKDVTDQFEDAVTAELKVYKRTQWYTIIDPDDGEILNNKKLRKKDVGSFLATYVEEEE